MFKISAIPEYRSDIYLIEYNLLPTPIERQKYSAPKIHGFIFSCSIDLVESSHDPTPPTSVRKLLFADLSTVYLKSLGVQIILSL